MPPPAKAPLEAFEEAPTSVREPTASVQAVLRADATPVTGSVVKALPPAPYGAPVNEDALTPLPAEAPRARTAVGQSGLTPQGPTGDGGIALPAAPVSLPELAPIPRHPEQPGPIGKSRYVFVVARGLWQRRRASAIVRGTITAAQLALDGLLSALGAEARASKLLHGPLADEQRAIDAAEERCGSADSALGDLARRRADELARFATQEAERSQALIKATAEVGQADGALREKRDAARALHRENDRLDGEIRRLVRSGQKMEQAAAKTLEDAAHAAKNEEAKRLTDKAIVLRTLKDETLGKAAALDEPLRVLAADLEQRRAAEAAARAALAETIMLRERTLAELATTQQRLDEGRQTAEREISRRLHTLGTLLNMNRVERASLGPLYAKIDATRGTIAAREEALARLATEQTAYDRAALQAGLLLLAGAFGLVLVIVLAVVLFL